MYSLKTSEKQRFKAKAPKANLLASVLFAFSLVALSAWGLNLVEARFSPATANAKIDILEIRPALAAELTPQAQLIKQNYSSLYIKPEASLTFEVNFKNISQSTWTSTNIYLKSSTTALKFQHPTWPNPYLPAKLQEKIVKPGAIGTFRLALKAPTILNDYTGDFLLVNNNVLIPGGDVSVTLKVVEDPAHPPILTNVTSAPSPPVATKACTLQLNIANASPGLDNTSCVDQLGLPSSGPDIHVGLFYSDKSIRITNNQAWAIYDQNDSLLASVPADQEITFFYIETKGEYAFDFIDRTIRTPQYLKLKNSNGGIFTIPSYNDILKATPNLNYNQFQGNLEIHHHDAKEKVWVIESLPLEKYMAGLRETSESDSPEYLKALAVAARTYALYHINKFYQQSSFFDVYADTRDQVYKGWLATQTQPKFVAATEQTQGIIAAYADKVIIAYYSASSGGRTASYPGLPYLQAKTAPYTAKLSRAKHTWGMDQRDARTRAKKDHWTYEQLLKYYYTNISLEKIY